MTRKIFIDCGTHLGQGIHAISKIKKFDHTWEIFTWEANPHTYKKYKETRIWPPHMKITSFNQAVGLHNGKISLTVNKTKSKGTDILESIGQATTTLSLDKFKVGAYTGTMDEIVDVECIDLVQWIEQKCNAKDLVIMKLDIEGLEYDLLEGILSSSIAMIIKEIFVEWHGHALINTESYNEREKQIKKLGRDLGINFIDWH
jgi:FkbM family methyltransferase